MTPTFSLSTDAQGRLILRRESEPDAQDVRLRRAFPWSQATHYVSVRSSEGKELLMIKDLGQLDPAQRDLALRWLEETSFTPRIERIESVDTRFGYQQWQVVTDRGRAEFRVQEREDIRFLPDGRFSVKDADGAIYELPALDALDPDSRRAIEALL
jgi:hypothetical protein